MGDELSGQWKRVPISVKDLVGFCEAISENNFRRGHSYVLKDYNDIFLVSILPVFEDCECGFCDKPLKAGDGMRFERTAFNLSQEPLKKGLVEEHGMVFFTHYHHLGK